MSFEFIKSQSKQHATPKEHVVRRMMGEEVNPKPKFCSECGKAVEGKGFFVDGDILCKEHYDAIDTKCEGCLKPIAGEFILQDGRRYHQSCYSQDIQCKGCNQMLFGEIFPGCGWSWHPACFKCNRCYRSLTSDEYVNRNGLPVCLKCNDQTPSPHEMVTIQRRPQLSEEEKQERSKQHLANKMASDKIFCAGCGNEVGVGGYTFGPSCYHKECFACVKCNTPVAEIGFRLINDEPHCANCSKSGGGGFCAGCGGKLTTYISALESKWHKECFVCSKCKGDLSKGFAEMNGEPVCGSCISSTSHKVVPTGERKGLRVDPRSGKRSYV